MKRGGNLQRKTPLRSKTGLTTRIKLRVKGQSEAADLKKEIQRLVRDIVIKRDGDCILRNIYRIPAYNDTGRTASSSSRPTTSSRAPTARPTPTRVVCICVGHHGWKKWHKEEYDALVKSLIGADRVALWERCEADSWRPHRAGVHDWKLAIVALKQECRIIWA